MKTFRITNLIFSFIFIFGLPVLTFAQSPDSEKIQTIYQWVKQKMDIKEEMGFPDIRFVNKPDLQQAFKNNNQQSYKSWQEEYGKEKAKEIFDSYLSGLLGLFDPTTKIIYVADFIEPCHKEAILAHELTHYVQEVGSTPVVMDYYFVGSDKYFREMYAYNIEEKYRQEFCERQKS